MSERYEDRSPEQIQHDIERTRAEMADTLETLRQKLSPGELLDQTIDYLKGSGAGQFSHNLGETVKHNPVPVALIGIGIAWLMMGGSRDPQWSSPGVNVYRTQSRRGEGTGSATGTVGQMAREAQERAHEAGARLSNMAHNAQERMSDTAEYMRDRMRSQAGRARETFDYLRYDHPMVLGALGFALGAAMGAGLPPTHREDALFGEVRDEYVQRAQEAGQEYLEKAKQVATAAGEAAKEQAGRENLPLGTTEQRTHVAEGNRQPVAQGSQSTAREETTRPNMPS